VQAPAPAACPPRVTPPCSYVFLYGVHYYMKNVHSSHYIAALLFFGYMAVVSFLFFVLTGATRPCTPPPAPAPRHPPPAARPAHPCVCRCAGFCGFVPTFFFVRTIYGAVKLD
jgi:hypothetical protein